MEQLRRGRFEPKQLVDRESPTLLECDGEVEVGRFCGEPEVLLGCHDKRANANAQER